MGKEQKYKLRRNDLRIGNGTANQLLDVLLVKKQAVCLHHIHKNRQARDNKEKQRQKRTGCTAEILDFIQNCGKQEPLDANHKARHEKRAQDGQQLFLDTALRRKQALEVLGKKI